ncbi:MAG: alpha-amylase family glycosyl hydrolase [Brachybacterium sp.]|nr:alpha-amylase family glycosyl hydrolase [Brachybacterium sp.]
MRPFPLTRRSRLRDLYAHPVGRDVIDKLRLYFGAPEALVRVLGPLPLSWIEAAGRRFAGEGFLQMILDLVNSEPAVPGDPGPLMPAAGAISPTDEDVPWWVDAVFYQVYPRSFADADGNGIGDLRGIIEHLDHLEELGVDCLWLSPVFDSPNRDMGYDVRDYRDVMEEMGTLEDLDELIADCHARGMRIILDLVVNHTSTEHERFQRALADPEGPDADFYHFVRDRDRPGEDTSTPPNNWTSFFSGSAWMRLEEAEAWVLHLFDESQVDLNWDNPEVRAGVARLVGWWLDRGIDGFRMDVINYISKPEDLPHGHPYIGALMDFIGIEHFYYGPRLHEYLAELRRNGFTREDGTVAVMIGETPGIGIEAGRLLSGRGRGELDMIFNFDGLVAPGKVDWHRHRYPVGRLVDFWLEYHRRIDDSDRIALFFENHDNTRMISKIAGTGARDPELRRKLGILLGAVQLTMPGTPFLYQGQELAAINEPFASLEDLRDVESLNKVRALIEDGASEQEAFAEVLPASRDHARTPIRWTEDQEDDGWWLPGHERTPGFSAAAQAEDPESVLSWYRRLIALRRAHPVFARGDAERLYRGRDCVQYVRRGEGEAILVELNWGPRARWCPAVPGRADVLASVGAGEDPQRLEAYSVRITELAELTP